MAHAMLHPAAVVSAPLPALPLELRIPSIDWPELFAQMYTERNPRIFPPHARLHYNQDSSAGPTVQQ